jgi:hypothetical protein
MVVATHVLFYLFCHHGKILGKPGSEVKPRWYEGRSHGGFFIFHLLAPARFAIQHPWSGCPQALGLVI